MGSFKDGNTIIVSGEKKEEIAAKYIIIATGSKPASLPFINIDKERIITQLKHLNSKKSQSISSLL